MAWTLKYTGQFKKDLKRYKHDAVKIENLQVGPNYPSSYVINTVCVPDSGTVVMDEKIFDNIPDAACCKLCVVRGDLENVDINGEKIRLMTESHDILGFILVRNISNRK